MVEPCHRVFVNSLPKSGTHLLINAVAAFGYADYIASGVRVKGEPPALTVRQARKALGEAGLRRNAAENGHKIRLGFFDTFDLALPVLQKWLESIPTDTQLSGHFAYDPALSALWHQLGYKHIGILRDPRAVAVSRLLFILEPGAQMREILGGQHFLETDLKAMSVTQRWNLMLEGGYAPQAGVTLGNFADAYHGILAWRDDPHCLMVRFEDLVGEQGGGSRSAQVRVLEKIAGHLEIPLSDAVLQHLNTIYDTSARTFKSGQIDGWRQRLEKSERDRLMAYCEPLCRAAGYTV